MSLETGIDRRALAVRLREIRGAALASKAETRHPVPVGRVKIGMEKISEGTEYILWTVDQLLREVEQPDVHALEHAER